MLCYRGMNQLVVKSASRSFGAVRDFPVPAVIERWSEGQAHGSILEEVSNTLTRS